MCKTTNLSYNYVIKHAALYFDYSSTITNVSYCSIISNYASKQWCIYLDYRSTSTYEVSSCNIINNTQTSQIDGMIICTKDTYIEHCCIKDNTGGPLFYIASGAKATIYETYIESDEQITKSNTFYIYNTLTESFVNTYTYLHCGNLLRIIKKSPQLYQFIKVWKIIPFIALPIISL